MFQSKEYILKKHGKTGTDRPYYLKQLTNEYKTTDKQGKNNNDSTYIFLTHGKKTQSNKYWLI